MLILYDLSACQRPKYLLAVFINRTLSLFIQGPLLSSYQRTWDMKACIDTLEQLRFDKQILAYYYKQISA